MNTNPTPMATPRYPHFAHGSCSYELQLDSPPGVRPTLVIICWDLDQDESKIVARIDPLTFGLVLRRPHRHPLVPPRIGTPILDEHRTSQRWTSEEDMFLQYLNHAGWSSREIAEKLNRSVRGVTYRLHRARWGLRRDRRAGYCQEAAE